MARSLSQTLIRTTNPTSLFSSTKSPRTAHHHVSRILTVRNQSSQPENSQLADPNLIDSSSSAEAVAVQSIEDAIHRIIVKRSAPDWLPFLPGSSYWVPPQRRSYGISELVHKLANTLTDEEVMSLATLRGWPSSAFFIHDAYAHLVKVEMAPSNMSKSKDEEG